MESDRKLNISATLPSEVQNDIEAALKVLKKGGLILYPTDTVWGIGCDATNSKAVEKVYSLKKRNEAKALITLVGNLNMLENTVAGIPDVAYELIEFSDKPLTIIYDCGIGVASNLLAEDGSLAVRLTNELFSATLCKKFGKPIVSTSANISGMPTPANFKDISEEIIKGVDYVCTTGRGDLTCRKSSTIMRLKQTGEFKIIRP